ncbi:hypothetical protein [uncultured Roseobacter sp.]|uniref:anti-sigma factor family protein n=1 Tax=uncultured Roseobacter sp. TaxID=114847 RepID=UPI00262F3AB3|nr:hypothetical protein [uncultured Roseobacter sp.]
MTDAAHITDEDLTAYLDDEVTAELRARIETALQVDPAVKARLTVLTLDIASLRRDMLASYPPAPPLPEMPVAPNAHSSTGIFATGLVAGLAISGIVFASFLAQPKPAEGWAGFVASYQMLYTAETLDVVDQSDADTRAQLQRVSAAVDLDLSILPEIDGLTLKRAQVLGFRGQPLVQIAYQDADGTPVALCIILADGQAPLALTEGEARGLQTVRWNRDAHGFLLIGDMDPAPLRQAAEVFAAAL